MVRFPFQFSRRKPSPFGGYSSKRRSRKKSIPLPFIIAAFPLGILVLEVLLRIGVNTTGKSSELAGYFGEPAIVSDYRPQLNTSSGQLVGGAPWGELKVRPSALTGYELIPNQKTNEFEINAQGFRASQVIPTAKPTNEVRILLVGGSVAFGTLSGNNSETIGAILETQLNQQIKDQKANTKNFRPDVLPYFADEMEKALNLPAKIREGEYRVINAAVPGYLSSNVLSQLSNQLLDYQPDVIVLIDGYGDLLAPSDRSAATLVGADDLLSNPTGHFFSSLTSRFNGLVNQLYLVKAFNAWILKPNPKSELLADMSNLKGNLIDRLSTDSAEIQKRIDRRTRALTSISKLAASRKIPFIVGIQPEVSQVKSPEESDSQVLRSLGDNYPQLIQDQYSKLVQAQKTVNGITALSFQEAIEQAPKTKGEPILFQDAIHPKARLRRTIASTIQMAIGPQLQVQPKPFSGTP
jgi:hypothetical protein